MMENEETPFSDTHRRDEPEIERAADLIRSGGVVAFPTETVYGLGADAFNPLAVARIFEIKNRPTFDPLIVHIAELKDLAILAERVEERVRHLAERFWPGPLTIILPKRNEVPDIVTAGLTTVGVRMPNHPMALDLIKAAQTPIAAPSANVFGSVSPTTADHVRASLGEAAVGLIVDGGRCEAGVESTIISFVDPTGLPVLLRPGAMAIEEIEHQLGPVRRLEVRGGSKEDGEKAPAAPGMLKKHYATRTPLALIRQFDSESEWRELRLRIERDLPKGAKIGLLCLGSHRKVAGIPEPAAEAVLSQNDDLAESAANLFAAMRRLDEAGLDLIVAIRVPDAGLGLAIDDRLERAVHWPVG